jgi:hypothetical protein
MEIAFTFAILVVMSLKENCLNLREIALVYLII